MRGEAGVRRLCGASGRGVDRRHRLRIVVGRATSVPSYDATRSSPDRATAIATSSGGGWLSRTVVAAQSDGASAASAPEV